MESRLKISLILFLFFLLALMFFSSFFQPKLSKIADLSSLDIGKTIRINATFFNLREFPTKSFQIFYLKDSSGVIEGISNSKTSLEKLENNTYLFTGRLGEYNKTLQLNVDKIVKG
jgi:hypothetical protein